MTNPRTAAEVVSERETLRRAIEGTERTLEDSRHRLAALESELAGMKPEFKVGDRVTCTGVVKEYDDISNDYPVCVVTLDGQEEDNILDVRALKKSPAEPSGNSGELPEWMGNEWRDQFSEHIRHTREGWNRGMREYEQAWDNFAAFIARTAPKAEPVEGNLVGWTVERVKPEFDDVDKYGAVHRTKEHAEAALENFYGNGIQSEYRVVPVYAGAQPAPSAPVVAGQGVVGK